MAQKKPPPKPTGRSPQKPNKPGAGKPKPKPPQPPAPQPPPQQSAPQDPGGFTYQQPFAQQAQGAYGDAMMGAGLGAMPSMLQNYGQQGQMGDIYAGGAAQNLGGAQQGMAGLQPLGQGYTGTASGTLGQYGQLMNPNMNIQQNLANQIQAIQSGADKGFDPLLDQQLGDQERVMHEQLRRQLGPDYANSSAGIEAMGKFNQLKQTTLGTSRFNQLNALINQQQGGMQNIAGASGGFANLGGGLQGQQFNQGAQLGQMFGQNVGQQYQQGMGFGEAGQNAIASGIQNTANTMGLYSQIPKTMGDFGQAMSNQAGAAIQGQQPYSHDRDVQAQLDANSPTQGSMWGQMAAQSGDRWTQVGGSMMGGRGGQ